MTVFKIIKKLGENSKLKQMVYAQPQAEEPCHISSLHLNSMLTKAQNCLPLSDR